MRIPRIKIAGRSAVYHCMSRVVGGQMLLGNPEKEKLRQLLWAQAAFCGVEVVTYCLMGNHFHVLVRVPEAASVPDQELVARVRGFTDGMVLGSRNYVNEVFAEFRDRFSSKRRSGARPLRGIGPALGDLTSARDLQVDAVG